MARCTFCSSELPPAPAGAAVRCPSCGNLTTTPSLPPTLASAPGYVAPPPAVTGLPFSKVDGPKPAAAPPPSIVLPSRAGGVDELVGGGLTILGIGFFKLLFFGVLVLLGTCMLGVLGLVFR